MCFDCELTRQVTVPFADPRRRYTHAFERYALELSRHMTIQDVAQHLHVSWDTIKDIQDRDPCNAASASPSCSKLQQIAIDEIAVGKGHHYLTVVLNLLSGAVVFVGDGKGVEALEPFWRRLRRARARIAGRGHRHVRGLHPGRARQPALTRSTSSTTSTSSSCSTTSSAPFAANCTARRAATATRRSSRARAGCC